MTRPGFRSRGGSQGASGGRESGDGFLSSSLFSQAQILHLMRNEFARARRHGMALGVLVLQVDRLAQLVDLHGVDLRQSVRAAVARLVREKTRGSDLLGATNDDRYLLVMPHTNLAQTRIVADRLHDLFGSVEVAVDGRPLALTLSVGVTACDEQKTLFFDSLLAQAEAAVEFATRNGGDQVVSFAETQLRADGGDPGPAGGRGRPGDARRGDGDGGEA
ncbi:MAG: GGDEF domain-containing protein [Planctomycetota bacterium]